MRGRAGPPSGGAAAGRGPAQPVACIAAGAAMWRAATARAESGYALVLFALLCLPVLGLAALGIELGFAGLAQARLQAASELAAREGPRGWLGSPQSSRWCAGSAEPSCDAAALAARWDGERRERAARQVAALFAPGAPGAPRTGPVQVLERRPGTGADPALGGLIGGVAARYEGASPLAPNATDEPAGDLVSGAFLGRTRTPGQIAPVFSCRDPQLVEPEGENCVYERADFAPHSAAPGPRRALLARLRLTGEAAVPGAAQPGAVVPVLFGVLVGSGGDPSRPPLRERGLRLRAGAIADARPALAASPPPAGEPGIANFALEVALWRSLPLDVPAALAVDGAGVVSIGGIAAGRVIAARPVGLSLGMELGAPAAGAAVAAPGGSVELRYVPLYRSALDGAARVVGFAAASLAADGGSLIPRAAQVAHSGASATPDLRAALAGLAPAAIDELFSEYREAAACDPDAAGFALALLCAPVLVR